MRTACLALCAVALALPAAALAQGNDLKTASMAPPVAPKPGKDPNRIVCEKSTPTGSRLGGTKVCRTAAEWAEIKALDRTEIERRQANRYNGNQ